MTKIQHGGPTCEMCGDQPTGEEMFLSQRCHMTAPLQVSMIDGILIIRCWIPDCLREIARFTIAPRTKH